jgi:hypothetical protein
LTSEYSEDTYVLKRLHKNSKHGRKIGVAILNTGLYIGFDPVM